MVEIAARVRPNWRDSSPREIPPGVKRIRSIMACLVRFLTLWFGMVQMIDLTMGPERSGFKNYNSINFCVNIFYIILTLRKTFNINKKPQV